MILTFKISLSPSLELKGNHFKLTKWLPTQQVSLASLGLKWSPWIHSSMVQIWRRSKTRDSELILQFFFSFSPLFLWWTVYREGIGKLGLMKINTGAPYMYKTSISNEKLNFVSIAWGKVRRGYSLHVPLECLYQAMQTR